MTNASKDYEFRLEPGRYRLTAGYQGLWYVTSATSGTTDLMINDLVVGQASGATPIRIQVSNLYGTVHGKVAFSEKLSMAWVYLIPEAPSISAGMPIPVRPDGSGTGSFTMRAPVGKYIAIALSQQLLDDLRDPELRARLPASAKEVEVGTADTPLNLDISVLKAVAR